MFPYVGLAPIPFVRFPAQGIPFQQSLNTAAPIHPCAYFPPLFPFPLAPQNSAWMTAPGNTAIVPECVAGDSKSGSKRARTSQSVPDARFYPSSEF
jgi:hypothetical protein